MLDPTQLHHLMFKTLRICCEYHIYPIHWRASLLHGDHVRQPATIQAKSMKPVTLDPVSIQELRELKKYMMCSLVQEMTF